MYIRITSRCNMKCKHCCFACTSEGEDMDIEIFQQAMEMDWDETLIIGGGEPTLHPKFWNFLTLALTEIMDNKAIELTINGKLTNTAIALAKMAKKGIICCSLSQDTYHDEIDPKVIDEFTYGPGDWSNQMDDKRHITSVKHLVNSGRCDFGQDTCPCDTIVVQPNGIVHQCACSDSPILGSIQKGWEPIDNQFNACYKTLATNLS